jgi:hypothetical protein
MEWFNKQNGSKSYLGKNELKIKDFFKRSFILNELLKKL